MSDAGVRPVTHDAVIVLPGVMGSELVDAATRTPLWGLANAGWYVRAWTIGGSLAALRVTDTERSGRAGRIQATRLLRTPAFAPVLRGLEPYRNLLAAIRRAVPDPAALREFPYDWRLSVEHNASELAKAADGHLRQWRAHPKGSKAAKLMLVAHSMGGLVARWFIGPLGGAGEVRATITLGTPLYGVVKAAYILSEGRGASLPLPRRHLRELASTLPGLYDLLPGYRCVNQGTVARRLTPGDLEAIGADAELGQEAVARQARLTAADAGPLRPLVGVDQPTMQSLVLRDGVLEPKYYLCDDDGAGGHKKYDRGGDGTVYRDSAAGLAEPFYVPQTHGALASTSEVIAHVLSVLTERPLGPPLGVTALGLTTPDVVTAGEQFKVTAHTADANAPIACRILDAVTGAHMDRPVLVRQAFPTSDEDAVEAGSEARGRRVAIVRLARPGLYRVELKTGGSSAVTQQVLVTPSD